MISEQKEKPPHLSNDEFMRNLNSVAYFVSKKLFMVVGTADVLRARQEGCVSLDDFESYFKRNKDGVV